MWKHMMAVCKSLEDNSKIFVISLLTSVNISCLFSYKLIFFLGLCTMSDFLMKHGHFRYYIMRLRILLKYFVLADLLWHCSGRESGDHLCYYWVWVRVQPPHLALADTTLAGEGRSILLLFPQSLHWYLRSRDVENLMSWLWKTWISSRPPLTPPQWGGGMPDYPWVWKPELQWYSRMGVVVACYHWVEVNLGFPGSSYTTLVLP